MSAEAASHTSHSPCSHSAPPTNHNHVHSHHDHHTHHHTHYSSTVHNFVPAIDTVHRLTAQLLAETTAADSHILVLGAGGGMELRSLATLQPHWQFTAVDPSSPMLEQAKAVLGEDESRVRWVNGVITDVTAGPYDGATCLMMLHHISGDSAKLTTLTELRSRLKPAAPLVLFDNCIDTASSDAVRLLDRYGQFAIGRGVEVEVVERNKANWRNMGSGVSPQRQEQLLSEAGYHSVELFYAALSWRAWVAYA